MDKELFRGRWNEMRGEIKNQWGKLTEDEIMQIKGDLDKLKGKIQERYSYSKEQAKDVIENFLKRFDS